MVVAQVPIPPGVDKVIEQAARSSWEAGLLAFVFVVAIIGLAWILKTMLTNNAKTVSDFIVASTAREARMAERINTLEEAQRSDLRDLVSANTKALTELVAALHGRPCFWNVEQQENLLANLERMHREREHSERPS